MNSALYDCQVSHERTGGHHRAFSYRVFYLWLDLDELTSVDGRSWMLGVGRRSLYSFQQSDHWPTGSGGLKERVLEWFAEHGVQTAPGESVRMLAIPRIVGFVFNPISFYFLVDATGRARAAAAEVENTFRERKLYLLPPEDCGSDGMFRTRLPKEFYVSPFVDLDVDFEFRFRLPQAELALAVNDLRGDSVVFRSLLKGLRRELTTANLLRLSVACPLAGLRVLALIHWQALRLWLRGVPWFSKSAGRDQQRDVLNPHKSLAQSSL